MDRDELRASLKATGEESLLSDRDCPVCQWPLFWEYIEDEPATLYLCPYCGYTDTELDADPDLRPIDHGDAAI